ncbi:MAG: hypothetical protein JKY56_03245 [Kofleriaceae bacterium]|nr:hypothetical protein [Kofleriaceae bacterium]
MEQRHSEYVEYYRARLQRYEGNVLYPHSAAAEKAIFDAISGCQTLEDFEQIDAQQQLTLRCAIALVRDKYTAESQLYLELQETVRAQPGLQILANLDGSPPATSAELTTMVNDIETQHQLKIAEDETLISSFWGDFKIMEDIEEDEMASIPPQWQSQAQESIAKELAHGAKSFSEVTLVEARKFFPNYQPNWDDLSEPRHRRKVPLPDEVFAARITNHKKYVGWE